MPITHKQNPRKNAKKKLHFFLRKQKTMYCLQLEDHKTWVGDAFGYHETIYAEICFTTSVCGYTESISDPSFRNQLLVFANPLIGNYGVNESHYESSEFVKGIVIARPPTLASHYTSQYSFDEWCRAKKIIVLTNIDTRSIVKYLRTHGTKMGRIGPSFPLLPSLSFCSEPLYAKPFKPYVYCEAKALTVICIDCGVKKSILEALANTGLRVVVVPQDYPLDTLEYDAIVISNGPGDPKEYIKTIETTRSLLHQDKPILGICLGHQILALASGGETTKMKFGHRGLNHAVQDLQTSRTYITSHNHGYSVTTIPNNWQPWFVDVLDGTNEGMFHESKPFYSVQFHPEASPGPLDSQWIFDMFAKRVKGLPYENNRKPKRLPPPKLHKVLLLGSGALSITSGGEFDYSGSQCIKSLQEEGIQVVLVNPNIASTQSSLADKTYYDPLTPECVQKIIDIEQPDGVLVQFGGQIALNCGLALNGANLLGTSREVIENTEDREKFVEKLKEINEPFAPSFTVSSITEAIIRANELGYPVLLRTGFSLGGAGSKVIHSESDLIEFHPTFPSRMDKAYIGWKELEYEVMRDYDDNCIVICDMENIDPLGVHTGDSMVVTPSQTLTNDEYFKLRSSAIKIIRHLNIIGECNIQFGLHEGQYIVIEVNARLSRSSALASKATGYPLAYVAAKLVIGKSLLEVKNNITRKSALFEPALDFVCVKIPRWDLQKFEGVSHILGSAMKSVGESMAIGRSFEEAFQNALRGSNNPPHFAHLTHLLLSKTIDEVHTATGIDPWFLRGIRNTLATHKVLTHSQILQAKQHGFTNEQIEIRNDWPLGTLQRYYPNLRPVMKHIDTCAAEFECYTNYLYPTWCGEENDVTIKDQRPGAILIGCGCYRVGSSLEYDFATVQTLRCLKALGWQTVSINNNPETVSTDYDECDRLYLADLHIENILHIWQLERLPVIVCMGGQIPNNLSLLLHKYQVPIMGTPVESIQMTEDRSQFSTLLDTMNLDQPQWAVGTREGILDFVERIGFPVLIRPSYVLGGANMRILWNHEQLDALSDSSDFVVTQFIEHAKEIEYDAVADHGEILNYAIAEHVEHCGTHGGDSTLILPPQKIYIETMRRIRVIASALAKRLNITGPFNLQFLCKHNQIKIIECNLRASRSLPFCSKTLDIDFVKLAVEALIGNRPIGYPPTNFVEKTMIGVKVPVFSFSKLPGTDPVLGVDMKATGEVASFGVTVEQAFLKAMLAAGIKPPQKGGNILITIGPRDAKCILFPYIQLLSQQGYRLHATIGTCQFYIGLPFQQVEKICSGRHPNVLDNFVYDMVFDVPNHEETNNDAYLIRRAAIDRGIGLLTNIQLIQLYIESLCGKQI